MFEIYKIHIENRLVEIPFPQQPNELYEPIQYLLSIGGKRIRPILVLLAAELFEENIEKAIPAALAVELFHNFTLMHDDIMDEAPLRRGNLTVHKKWNQNVAILAGDNMFVWAYKQIANCEADKIPALLHVFNQMAQEVCEGQQWDMLFEKGGMVERREYIEMIRQKTAVLLGAALKMGAIIAGAPEEDAENLYQFGINIGIAFQLQDDILDTYGDSKSFGKQIGGDVLANKKTILLVEAFSCAPEEDKLAIERLLAINGQISNEIAEQKIKDVKAIYERLNVQERASEIMQHYVDQANSYLKKLSVPSDKRYNLSILAKSLITRSN